MPNELEDSKVCEKGHVNGWCLMQSYGDLNHYLRFMVSLGKESLEVFEVRLFIKNDWHQIS